MIYMEPCHALPPPLELDSILFSPLTHPYEQYGSSIATNANQNGNTNSNTNRNTNGNVLVISNNAIKPVLYVYNIRNNLIEEVIESDDYSYTYTDRDDDNGDGDGNDTYDTYEYDDGTDDGSGGDGNGDRRLKNHKKSKKPSVPIMWSESGSGSESESESGTSDTSSDTSSDTTDDTDTSTTDTTDTNNQVYWVESQPNRYIPADPTVSGLNSVVDIYTNSKHDTSYTSTTSTSSNTTNTTTITTSVIKNDTITTIVVGYPERISCMNCHGVVYIYTEYESMELENIHSSSSDTDTGGGSIMNHTNTISTQIIYDPEDTTTSNSNTHSMHSNSRFGCGVSITHNLIVIGASEMNILDVTDSTDGSDGTDSRVGQTQDIGGGQLHTGYKIGGCYLYSYDHTANE